MNNENLSPENFAINSNKSLYPPEMLQQLIEELKQAPLDIDINIKLKGAIAAKYNLISKVMEIGLGLNKEDINLYLFRKGIEAELVQLARVINEQRIQE